MTKNSAMFVAGPPVVKRLGQDLTKQELGGADIQTRAGGVDDAVDTEEEAFERVQALPVLSAVVGLRVCRRQFPATTIRSVRRNR